MTTAQTIMASLAGILFVLLCTLCIISVDSDSNKFFVPERDEKINNHKEISISDEQKIQNEKQVM
jgi:hypothetical protein